MITENKISEIVKKIASGYNPEKIILFGSYASGTAAEDSDIDIFVIKDSELPRPQRTMQLRRILLGSQVPMDLIVYTPNEVEREKDEKYSFVYEVLNSGKTVYERKND
ncbi:MAG: nucleotidyltransferase domain-containing protein [Bacteroidetes bacterium]|nr:MAG: nucleotidyltransferase domain-containing protein [Bacteroidota bacterium]